MGKWCWCVLNVEWVSNLSEYVLLLDSDRFIHLRAAAGCATRSARAACEMLSYANSAPSCVSTCSLLKLLTLPRDATSRSFSFNISDTIIKTCVYNVQRLGKIINVLVHKIHSFQQFVVIFLIIKLICFVLQMVQLTFLQSS